MTNSIQIAGVNVESTDIPVYKVDYLKKKIAKMNRKAAKLGCDPMVLTLDNPHTVNIHEHPITGHKLVNPIVVEMLTATLAYVIPTIEGYELIATLDLFGSEVLISAVPDKVVPDEWKYATSIKCDHCGWNRRRNHSILLRNIESGEYKEVGSTCVKDFFDGVDPMGFMYMASIKFDHIIGGLKEEGFGQSGSSDWGNDIIEVLSITAACITKWGWLSKGQAWKMNQEYDANYISTASHVCDNIEPTDPKMEKSMKVDVIEEDIKLAEETAAYFTDLDPKDNDYLLNCCKIMKIGYVPNKYIGVACSMITAYQKAMAKIAKYEKKNDGPASEWQGQLKERLKGIKVECTYVRHLDTDFGESTLYAFTDASGNIYKTFYSGSTWSLEVGDVVLIDGTVKKHNDFHGKKETMLNRVAVKEAPEEEFTIDEFAVA